MAYSPSPEPFRGKLGKRWGVALRSKNPGFQHIEIALFRPIPEEFLHNWAPHKAQERFC